MDININNIIQIPLEDRLKANNMLAFVDLLYDLGYREDLLRPENEEKAKIVSLAVDKLAREQEKILLTPEQLDYQRVLDNAINRLNTLSYKVGYYERTIRDLKDIINPKFYANLAKVMEMKSVDNNK